MFELVQVGRHTYYIDYPSKIGIYKPDDSENVYLIDSGNDGRIAKRALRTINERGWCVKAIFNTHCHADHVGGNAYFQEQTDCVAYVPDIDCAAVNFPILNSIMLYGSYPTKELANKFYMADQSVATPLSEAVMPEGLECIPLYGHTLGMVGYKTCDGVLFIADSVASPIVLEKYKVTYLVDVVGYLETLEKLEGMDGTVYVPSHGETTEDIRALTEVNREYVLKVTEDIIDFCSEPRMLDEVTKHFFDNNDVIFNMMQAALIGSTVRSYLSYLKESGRIDMVYIDNCIKWIKKADTQ